VGHICPQRYTIVGVAVTEEYDENCNFFTTSCYPYMYKPLTDFFQTSHLKKDTKDDLKKSLKEEKFDKMFKD
jgi:hypothetical protein